MTRTALVTGSERGIGKATITAFAKKGYDVAITSAHHLDAAQALADDLTKRYGVKAVALQADLTQDTAAVDLAHAAEKVLGHVDVLVNNAGMAPYNQIKDMTMKSWETTLRVNLIAPFLLAQQLGPKMVERGYGKIVSVSSFDATYGANPQSAEYDASKAALVNLTRNLAQAFKPVVNVNAVAPGFTKTDMAEGMDDSLPKAKLMKGRFGKPEEIAALIAFLASDNAEFIDAQTIYIDGGFNTI